MARTVRIPYNNLVQASATVLVPSSEETSLPRSALTRQGLGDKWRSKTGWTIVTGDNDTIDFNRGGVKQATIAAGTYATGSALAAAIVTALEAADATPVWACDYNVAATDKFRISSDLAFVLLFGSGATVDTKSVHFDIGFAQADTASATSHTAGSVSYQSQHALHVDLGSAQAGTVIIARGHNFSAAASIEPSASTATTVGAGFRSSLDLSTTMSGTDPRIKFISSLTKRYWRLVIRDVQNTAGYVELAIWFVGTYSQPSTPESVIWSKEYEQLSETYIAIGGANTQARRSRRAVYQLQWRTNATADVTIFEDLDSAMPAGHNFFISFDAEDNPTTSTVYGFLREGLVEQRNDGALYVLPLVFVESLP